MKNKKLSKFLAVVSLVTATGLSSNAFAARYIGTGGAVSIVNGVAPANTNAGAALWAPGDSFTAGTADNLTLGANSSSVNLININNGTVDLVNAVPAGGATVATIDTNGFALNINLENSSSVGSIVNTTNNVTSKLAITQGTGLLSNMITGENALGQPQAAGNFSGLGAVTIDGDTPGAGLIVGSNLDLPATVDSVNNPGRIEVLSNLNSVQFTGVIGSDSPIGTIQIDDNSNTTFSKDVTASKVTLNGANAQISVTNDATISAPIDGAQSGQGILTFAGNGTFGGIVGGTNPVATISVGANEGTFLKNASATNITVGTGTLFTDGNLTGAVNFTADGRIELQESIIDGNVTTSAAKTGTLEFAASNAALTGAAGTSQAPLKAVEIGGDTTFNNTSATNHYAQEFRFVDTNTLTLANGHVLNGNITLADGNNSGTIQFQNTGKINGIIGASGKPLNIITTNGLVDIITGQHYGTFGFDLKAGPNAGFNFADGANVEGKIDNGVASNGTINFAGNSTIKGAFGAMGSNLANVNVNGPEASVVTVDNVIYADNITIANGGTIQFDGTSGAAGAVKIGAQGGRLIINGDNDHTFANVDIAAHTNPAVIEITKNVGTAAGRTVNLGRVGQLGQMGQNLDTLIINTNGANGDQIVIADQSSISEVQFSSADDVLRLDSVSGTYQIDAINPQADGQGIILLPGDTTLQTTNAEANLGTMTNRLNSVQFSADKTLTLGDNVNLYAKVLSNSAVQTGTINFSGTNILSAPNMSQFKAFNVNNGTVTLAEQNNVVVVNLTGADATLKLANNLTTSTGVIPGVTGQGAVIFTNSTPITDFNSSLGSSTNRLAKIQFSGSDVSIAAGKITDTLNYDFNAQKAMTFTLDNTTTTYDNVSFTNNSAEGVIHNIALNVPTTTFGPNAKLAFDNDGARKLNFIVTGSAVIQTPNAHGANFIASANEVSVVNLNAANGVINSIGADGKALDTLSIASNYTVRNGVYAKTVNIAAGQTANFGGMIVSSGGINLGSGTTLNLSDGATLSAPVNGAVANQGILTVEKSATINQNLGANNSLNTITFSDDTDAATRINLGSQLVNATNVNFNRAAVAFSGENSLINGTHNVEINGQSNFNNSNIDLRFETVKLNGPVTFQGSNVISASVADALMPGTIDYGQIVIGQNQTLNIDPASSVTLTLNDRFLSRNGISPVTMGMGLTLGIIETSGTTTGAFNKNNVSIKNQNPFIAYELVDLLLGQPAQGLYVSIVDNTKAAINTLATQGNITEVEKDNLLLIADAPFGTDAFNFLNTLTVLGNGLGGFSDAAIDAVKRINPVNNDRLSVQTANLIGNTLLNRLGTNAAAEFVGSGDDHMPYGAWAMPFTMATDQKRVGDVSGYRSYTHGATVGADYQVNDHMKVGAALSYAHSDIKHRDFKDRDSSNINLYGFSLYGMRQLDCNWHMRSAATFADNNVKSRENRVGTAIVNNVPQATTEVVTSKYHSMLFSFHSMLGYDYRIMGHKYLMDSVITPSLGAKYTRVSHSGYKEKGATLTPNQTITQKPTDRLDLVAGLQATGRGFTVSNLPMVPEMHAMVSHDLIDQNDRMSIIMDGAEALTSFNGRIGRTHYNFGLSINSNYNNVDFGIGYDAYLTKGSVSHRGSLKVRVEF